MVKKPEELTKQHFPQRDSLFGELSNLSIKEPALTVVVNVGNTDRHGITRDMLSYLHLHPSFAWMEGQEERIYAVFLISNVEEVVKKKAGNETRTRDILLGKQALYH